LVDDDEDEFVITRDLLSEIEGRQYKLNWVASYDAALDAITCNTYDVYLVDYRLGGRNGLDLLLEAKRLQCNAPFILLTGQGGHNVDVEAMEAGAADYLVKRELTPQILERAIRYAVAHKRTETYLRESEERYRRFFEDDLTGDFIAIPNGSIIDCNPAFA